jgi:UDP-glucose 4-epimerase
MKCLVTGGCGFIGSNLVDELINQNHDVVVIDNLSSDAHDQFYFNKKATYYNYDIQDHRINGLFEQYKFEYVFHLAAEARIQNCINDPSKALNTNTIGTQYLLQAANEHKVKRFILSSTSAIYGLNEILPQTESLPVNCLNMYSYSKWFSENLCKMYANTTELDTICFRYFNVYGPRQPIRGSYAPVIGVFSRQKKAGEPMTIVGDGLQTRDYVHVSDVVNANISAMNKIENLNGEIINIGSEMNYSVLDIAKFMGGEYIYLPPRIGEAKNTLSNCNKAKQLLNWSSKKKLLDYLEKKDYELTYITMEI